MKKWFTFCSVIFTWIMFKTSGIIRLYVWLYISGNVNPDGWVSCGHGSYLKTLTNSLKGCFNWGLLRSFVSLWSEVCVSGGRQRRLQPVHQHQTEGCSWGEIPDVVPLDSSEPLVSYLSLWNESPTTWRKCTECLVCQLGSLLYSHRLLIIHSKNV